MWKKNGQRCDWLADLHMLPSYIPNSRIFFFEWNSGFEDNAPNDILLGPADTLLRDLHAARNPIPRVGVPMQVSRLLFSCHPYQLALSC